MNLADHFLRFDAAPLLLFAPIAGILLWGLDRARTQNLARMAGTRAAALAPDLGAGRRRLRRALGVAALLLVFIAVLEPVWGESVEREDQGVDVLVVLDVSRSMLARDADPSRLEAARREIRALADRARGDRIGLVVYAGQARLVVPLTRDRTSFSQLLDLAEPHTVARGGTDPGAGLDLALQALTDASGRSEAIVLVTDGDDPEQHGLGAALKLKARGIAVHCAGFGSARGAKIPIESGAGETFLRDKAGSDVVSSMDAASLRAIAEATGGAFVAAASETHPLVTLYEDRILPMAKKRLPDERRRERDSRFQWALFPAILLWMLDLGLTDRETPVTARLACLLVLAAALAACDDFETGTSAYREGRFKDAQQAFAASVVSAGDDAPAELLYDLALCALRAGDLKLADASAERAASVDPELRPLCDFVRGNAAFAKCEVAAAQAMSLEAEPFAFDVAIVAADAARRLWQDAATSRADWPEARRNVERALHKLAELRDKKSQAEKSAKNRSQPNGGQQEGTKEKPAPDAPPPPPPPPSGEGKGSDPSETPDEPQLAELSRDQVLRLFEKLAEKERERLAKRRSGAKGSTPEVDRDW